MGSIRALAAGLMLTLTAISFTPTMFAESQARRIEPANEKAADEAKTALRSPEEAVRAGIEYLLKQQQADGGWGQGDGWRQNRDKGGGRVEGAGVEDPPDLGNTAVSLVTLLRAGHAPADGEHREAARKAFEFVCRQVEQADDGSLYVTPVRDTQLQVKIGAYVDTFLAGWALSEIKGRLADEDAEKRRATALDKVVSKIERNQREDGSFEGNKGWAAVLSQGLCSKALNSAARSGATVSKSALDKDQLQNLSGLNLATGAFTSPTAAAEPSSAGVDLYRESAKLGGLREKEKSNVARKTEAERKLADASAPAPEQRRREELKQIASDEAASQVAQNDRQQAQGHAMSAGFGNNGGEEFLSYLNLGEHARARREKRGEDWKTKMQTTLCGAQNADGSWAGQHCITGAPSAPGPRC